MILLKCGGGARYKWDESSRWGRASPGLLAGILTESGGKNQGREIGRKEHRGSTSSPRPV